MIQINLLPDIKIVYLKVRRLRMIVFMVALFVITGCTIALLLMGLDTLVRQTNNVLTQEEKINAYVEEFNGDEGEDVRTYLAIQRKFETLGQLAEKKIDPTRLWNDGLFGANPETGTDSFLPSQYLNQIELYDFDFETREFTIVGSVDAAGQDVNLRDHFRFAYYEIGNVDESGRLVDWSCPLAPDSELRDRPAWTYCRMFDNVTRNSEFNPDLGAKRKVTISGEFKTEVTDGIHLFDKDVKIRVKVPTGCADNACIDQPDIDDDAPQEFAENS